ncbi:RBCMT [Symbiodinium pilosum]|uniref:RBCMT protein n=1 Tax=Symbiodinium pilosum TaxID=2952 RepID=A0A812TR74_SYMPI|nr:RBCMT [Symbiodinium pilosum]
MFDDLDEEELFGSALYNTSAVYSDEDEEAIFGSPVGEDTPSGEPPSPDLAPAATPPTGRAVPRTPPIGGAGVSPTPPRRGTPRTPPLGGAVTPPRGQEDVMRASVVPVPKGAAPSPVDRLKAVPLTPDTSNSNAAGVGGQGHPPGTPEALLFPLTPMGGAGGAPRTPPRTPPPPGVMPDIPMTPPIGGAGALEPPPEKDVAASTLKEAPRSPSARGTTTPGTPPIGGLISPRTPPISRGQEVAATQSYASQGDGSLPATQAYQDEPTPKRRRTKEPGSPND